MFTGPTFILLFAVAAIIGFFVVLRLWANKKDRDLKNSQIESSQFLEELKEDEVHRHLFPHKNNKRREHMRRRTKAASPSIRDIGPGRFFKK